MLGERRMRSMACIAEPLPRLKPNLLSSCPVAMNSCVCACNPGVIRANTCGARQALRVQSIEAIEFVEAVDHDVAHTLDDRHAQLVDALVVAVHHERTGGHTGAQRDEQLAAAGDIEQHAFVVRQPSHRRAQERLRCVHRVAETERRDSLATACAQMRLVVDEQWGAVLGCQFGNVAAADRQRSVGLHSWRIGQQAERKPTHIRSGASIPSSARPCCSVRAVRSHSARRLSRVAS